jgi:localization factor PodJL
MTKNVESHDIDEELPDLREDATAAAQPVKSSVLRKKPVMSLKLEQVLNDIAPEHGKEHVTGAVAKFDRRLQVLEKAFADLADQHELSVKARVRAIATTEESITGLMTRMDGKDQDVQREFAGVRLSLALLEARISDQEQAARGAQPASIANDESLVSTIAEAAVSMASDTPASQAAAEPQAPRSDPDGEDDYLTSARRAALAVAVASNDAPMKEKARRRDTRTKILALAILAPIVILGVAFVLLGRNTLTANPVLAARQQNVPPAVPQADIAPVPSGREAAAPLPARTLSILRVAADAGDVTAMRDLGLKYLTGDEVEARDIDAARWLIRAAYRNDAEGQYWLGTLYAQGRGVPKDTAQAIHWYETAAGQGHVRAMHNLGAGYYEGWDGQKNLAQAAKWFEAASEGGSTDSAFNLAVLYELGRGVKQDAVEAFKWYSIAAAAGDAEAAKRVEFLVPQLSPEDLQAATEAVAAFKR